MPPDLDTRLARIEADLALRQLVARYCFFIDDRDLDGVATLFTPDAVVRSGDGVMNARGRDALIAQYRDRFRALGPGAHYMHDVAIWLDSPGTDRLPDTARLKVSGHAELWRNGQMMVVGLRYDDTCRLTAEGWRFAERVIQYLYYCPVQDYPGILGRTERNLAYATPSAADVPENTATWKAYHAGT